NSVSRADAPTVAYEQVERSGCVTFIRSFTDEQKRALLSAAAAVLYTPTNEHFGIVPLEAMLAGRPVVAVASGGPLESIANNETGFLCSAQPEVRINAQLAGLQPTHAYHALAVLCAPRHSHVAHAVPRYVHACARTAGIRSLHGEPCVRRATDQRHGRTRPRACECPFLSIRFHRQAEHTVLRTGKGRGPRAASPMC
ncbi:glycosyltransferase, partial [archaeon]